MSPPADPTACLTPPGLRVRRLSSGLVRPKAATRGIRRYLPGGWSTQTLPVNAFLIEHRRGACLFDTGQTARAAGPGYLTPWHPYLRLARFELQSEDEVPAQLARGGVPPAAVTTVVLSHLHTDHVGTVGSFAHSDVLVARAEWTHAAGRRGVLRGYLPQHWPPEVSPTLVDFRGPPRGPFARTHDVLGDGSLLLVPLPGHSPGHLGMLVDVAPRALLVGDLVHDLRDLGAAAPEIAAFCRGAGVAVLCAHDHQPPIPVWGTGDHDKGDG